MTTSPASAARLLTLLLFTLSCAEPVQPPVAAAPVEDSVDRRFGDSTSGTPDIADTADTADAANAHDAFAEQPDTIPVHRQRDCSSHFSLKIGKPAAKVSLAGSWDWALLEPLQLKGDTWELSKTLPHGLHCYKFIVDGEWQLDPGTGYRAWCNGTVNSGLRVPDCDKPLLTLEGEVKVSANGLQARVLFWQGGGDSPPAEVKAMLLHDFKATAIEHAWQASDASVNIDLAGLAAGKYTVKITAKDASGGLAEPILLPFWVEKKAYSWHDALIYLAMIDRFSDGDPANNANGLPDVDPGAQWHGGELKGITAAIEAGWFDALSARRATRRGGSPRRRTGS